MNASQPKDRIGLARKDVRRFQKDVDKWKRHHDELENDGWVREDLIAKANFLFGRLLDLDNDIQEAVLSGKLAYHAEIDQEVTSLFRGWHEVATELLPLAERMQSEFGSVEGGDLLAVNLTQARDILTPDSEFFSSPMLEGLEEDALRQHRAEQTKDLEFDEHGIA